MNELLEILKGVRPDIDFEKETALIDNEILDSFDVISIVSEVNEAFGVEINMEDLLPENFNSAEAIYALILKMQG
ncbi:MAG: acyl carrier protein [Lachnospiraceae bacterium]|nr:acyl carrier protein [Lachnospiraceae bacterium]